MKADMVVIDDPTVPPGTAYVINPAYLTFWAPAPPLSPWQRFINFLIGRP